MQPRYLLKLYQLFALVCLLALLAGCQAKGIINLQSGNALASQQWQGSSDTFTLPFDWHDGHIIIEMRINNSSNLRFALDSAASATVLFETERTNQIKLDIEGQLELNGKQINIVNNTQITVGNIQLSDLTLVHVPLEQNPLFDDLQSAYFDGAIGYDIFNHYNVTIHYAEQFITFSKHQDTAISSLSWQQYPLFIHSRIPYIKANLAEQKNSKATYKFVVDTGAPDYIYLNENLAEGFSFPNAVFHSQFENFDGIQTIETGRIGQFELFGESFNNISAHHLPKLEDEHGVGLIGSALLRNFDIHFNYQQGYIAVRKGKKFSDDSFIDRSGLVIEPHKLGAIVKQIDDKSDASKLAIQSGTIITHINNQAITTNNFDKLRLQLSQEKPSVNVCWLANSNKKCADVRLYNRI
ncbi:hypothetical protein PA25_23380 [Pseudoalteromonas sp. A25]|uniref:hypothetical protein n=1 Tax=Pseudoalteromonas sp. A25 TaxID=116092 RepID=UPI001260945A|nr:hypothetical protein [Pseudoalteromonas sp. A25]BBN82353.1 hypothetical protein PA25_23380 [Pseudoalteromonas sp. A25]